MNGRSSTPWAGKLSTLGSGPSSSPPGRRSSGLLFPSLSVMGKTRRLTAPRRPPALPRPPGRRRPLPAHLGLLLAVLAVPPRQPLPKLAELRPQAAHLLLPGLQLGLQFHLLFDQGLALGLHHRDAVPQVVVDLHQPRLLLLQLRGERERERPLNGAAARGSSRGALPKGEPPPGLPFGPETAGFV